MVRLLKFLLINRTEGAAIEMASSTFILPAQSLHTHVASFIPREAGPLLIKGCTIKFSTCRPGRYPLFGKRSRREQDLWYDARGGSFKVKSSGLSALEPFQTPTDIKQRKLPEDFFWPTWEISANVIPPQPHLVPGSVSLLDGCLVLLEGEAYLCHHEAFLICLESLSL